MMIRNIAPKIKQKKHSKRVFEKRLFKVLVGGFFVGVVVYVYSLSSVVFAVIERRSLTKEIALLSSQTERLEKEYLAKTSDITLETASLNGFVKADKIYYESQEHVAINTTQNTERGL